MPHLLAHFGVQGVATRSIVPDAPLRWVFLGSLLSDIPWVLQRIAWGLELGIDRYDLRLYTAAQASLFGTLPLCGALALLAKRSWHVFLILALNAVLHLLIDAFETKWGNGVHLFAPLSWRLLNFGLFWPESPVLLALTLFGLGYALWAVARSRAEPWSVSWPPLRRLAAFGALLAVYFILPEALRGAPEAIDSSYVRTLRELDARTGRYLELDRGRYIARDDGDRIRTFAGEELRVSARALERSTPVSVRGLFADPRTLEIRELHAHPPHLRDGASYVGLVFISLVWLRGFRRAGR